MDLTLVLKIDLSRKREMEISKLSTKKSINDPVDSFLSKDFFCQVPKDIFSSHFQKNFDQFLLNLNKVKSEDFSALKIPRKSLKSRL